MNSSIPNSIALYNSFGILRSELEHVTNEEFSIPMPFLNCFDKYFLLYWERDYLLSQLEGSKGIITRDGISYQWILRNHLSLGKIAANPDPNKQYALSFRRPKKEFNLLPTVLISL